MSGAVCSIAQAAPQTQFVNSDSIYLEFKNRLIKARHANQIQEMVDADLTIGTYLQQTGLLAKALEHFNSAHETLMRYPNDTLLIKTHNLSGSVHLLLSNYEVAEQNFNTALELANQIEFLPGLATALEKLGTCHEKKGDFDKALDYQRKSLKVFEKLGDHLGLAVVLENIGSVYEDQNLFLQARDFFDQALAKLANKPSSIRASVYNNIADIHRKQNHCYKAVEYTKLALKDAEQVEDLKQQVSAHKDLSVCYAELDSFSQAYKHISLGDDIREELLLIWNTDQVNRLHTIYETDKKEAQIKLLQHQNELTDVNQKLMIISFIAFLIFIGSLYLIYAKKQRSKSQLTEYRRQKAQDQLEKKELQEQNLKREIELKTVSLSNYSLHIAKKNKQLHNLATKLNHLTEQKKVDYKKQIADLAKNIEYSLKEDNEWDQFVQFFQEVHPDFIGQLNQIAISPLSPAELRLCLLLRLNLNSKEMASILRITPDSVRVARYRLRKKLAITQGVDLTGFMAQIAI